MIENNAQSKGNPEVGNWLNFSANPTDTLHDFCGPHDIAGAHCPNCNKPLMRLLSLDAKDERLRFDPVRQPVVHLLYCWTCSIPFGEFTYKVTSDGSVELLQVPPRKPEMEFGQEGPYEGYTGVFPHRQVSLQPLTADEEKQLRARVVDDFDDGDEDLFTPRHQVGGYPFIYNPSKTSCPLCSSEMPLLAAICDSSIGNDAFGIEPENSFTGNGGVQMLFQFCRDCSVVSAYQSCD
jgi:hypothetical protein